MKLIKLAVFDLGNTLISKQTNELLSSGVINCLNELKRKGIKVGIATMRNHNAIKNILEQFDFDFLILLNGTRVMCDNNIINDNPINHDTLIKLIDFADNSKDHLQFYLKDYIIARTKEDYDIALSNQFKCGVISNDFNLNEVYNLALFTTKKDYLIYEEAFPNLKFNWWNDGIKSDIHPIENSKKNGLEMVCKYYSIHKENIIAFGDGPNDIEMLKYSGTSVAMGGAPDEVLNICTYHTTSVLEEGVVTALKKVGLI